MYSQVGKNCKVTQIVVYLKENITNKHDKFSTNKKTTQKRKKTFAIYIHLFFFFELAEF